MLFLQNKFEKGEKILYKNYFVLFTNFFVYTNKFYFVLKKNWLQNSL